MEELHRSPVIFDDDNHTYHLGDVELKGVTGTLIKRAYPDKYKDVDPSVLSKAAEKGHELHSAIEFHDTFGTNGEEHADPRITNYERLKKENGLTTIANEYLVSDEEHYASSVDIVMENKQKEICLIDVKTTYTLDRESTALQLSIYKRWFERQNPLLIVKHLYVMWLPNKDLDVAELHELRQVSDEAIDALIEADLNDKPFDVALLYGNLPAVVAEAEAEIENIEKQLKEMKNREDELKKGLYGMMEEYNIKSFRGQKVLLTRVLPTTKEALDTKRLKEEMPEIFEQFKKVSNVSGSLKITLLNN